MCLYRWEWCYSNYADCAVNQCVSSVDCVRIKGTFLALLHTHTNSANYRACNACSRLDFFLQSKCSFVICDGQNVPVPFVCSLILYTNKLRWCIYATPGKKAHGRIYLEGLEGLKTVLKNYNLSSVMGRMLLPQFVCSLILHTNKTQRCTKPRGGGGERERERGNIYFWSSKRSENVLEKKLGFCLFCFF